MTDEHAPWDREVWADHRLADQVRNPDRALILLSALLPYTVEIPPGERASAHMPATRPHRRDTTLPGHPVDLWPQRRGVRYPPAHLLEGA